MTGSSVTIMRAAAVIMLASVSLPAAAQAPSQPPTQAPPPGSAPPEVMPERSDPKACNSAGRETTGAPLSDKLARTDGVICPPAGVDPDIKAPPPQSGSSMPVIPPPGSPGGDPAVRPK